MNVGFQFQFMEAPKAEEKPLSSNKAGDIMSLNSKKFAQ